AAVLVLVVQEIADGVAQARRRQRLFDQRRDLQTGPQRLGRAVGDRPMAIVLRERPAPECAGAISTDRYGLGLDLSAGKERLCVLERASMLPGAARRDDSLDR